MFRLKAFPWETCLICKHPSLLLATLACFMPFQCLELEAEQETPNVILIYADDLGYADVGCYGATEVHTPHIDRLAENGIVFTDAHAPAATCTPSRYAMLTGEYAWRRKGTGIARGDAPLIIDPETITLADIFKEGGYHTGVIGKWHLGLGPEGGPDWNGIIKPGPLELGFDDAFLIPATGDRVPCVYVENHRVVNLDPRDPIKVSFRQRIGDEPIGKENPGLLKMHPSHGHDRTIINGISRIGYMSGGNKARWKDEDMADTITERALRFMEARRQDPFFLFFSLHDIHVPRVPHPRFVGKTTMGPRGDAIVQTDWCVGKILEKLQELGLSEKTMVLFTSDNGPVMDDGYRDRAVEQLGKHQPAGPFRGGKYSAFEGGTRVPWIVSWPGHIKPGKSSALVSQVDLPACFADMLKKELPDDGAPDSFNVLAALMGQEDIGRPHLIEQSRTLSLRHGDWKWIEPSDGPSINKNTNTELGLNQEAQLYYLGDDLGERRNLIKDYPEKALWCQRKLQAIREAGQSRRP
jgi:arylsulfatase A-like enzyme